MNCPLCNINLSEEKIFYEDSLFLVVRTKNLKGHRERIMIILKEHNPRVNYKVMEAALDILAEIGKKVFSYTPKWVIMDSTFATIKQHWHLVASDLNPKSDDFEQMLITKWVKIIDNVNS